MVADVTSPSPFDLVSGAMLGDEVDKLLSVLDERERRSSGYVTASTVENRGPWRRSVFSSALRVSGSARSNAQR